MQTNSRPDTRPVQISPQLKSGAVVRPVRNIPPQKATGKLTGTGFSNVAACLDQSPQSMTVLHHAKAVAAGLELPVKLVHVVEATQTGNRLSDPIEWKLKQQIAEEHLSRIQHNEQDDEMSIDRLLLNGLAGEELPRWARDHDRSVMAMSTRCGLMNAHLDLPYDAFGSTTQKVLEQSTSSLLLIPPATPEVGLVSYHQILVPLDGSARAESVLPTAVRIARHHHAVLVLVHIVSVPEFVEAAPVDEITRDLAARLLEYSERNARTYLTRLESRLYGESVTIRSAIASDSDVRDRLLKIAEEQNCHLIVMAGRGKSGSPKVSCGNVARYIATHANFPVFMIRGQVGRCAGRRRNEISSQGSRLFWNNNK